MQYASMVKEVTTAIGTNDLTLEGAASGFRTLSAAGLGINNYWVEYTVKDANGVDWEHGLGQVKTGPLRIVRSLVLESTNSDAAITLSSGTHTVGLFAQSSIIARRRGAQLQLTTSNPVIADQSYLNIATWDVVDINTDGAHTPGQQWVSAPAWADVVELHAAVDIQTTSPPSGGGVRVAMSRLAANTYLPEPYQYGVGIPLLTDTDHNYRFRWQASFTVHRDVALSTNAMQFMLGIRNECGVPATVQAAALSVLAVA